MKIYDYMGKENICGANLRKQRVRKKLSQSVLAARMQLEGVNIERDSISRIERGERFVADYELLVMAKVLDVAVELLIKTQPK